MNVADTLARMEEDAQSLNAAVRLGQDTITVAQGRDIARSCREIEGWLVGIRRLLEVEA